jgi:hypothetical protein
VPPIVSDSKLQLNRQKYPFYEHSEAAFFMVRRDGRDVGRLAAFENKPYNSAHGTRDASFTFFECERDDEEAAALLFDRGLEWARSRRLDRMVGPRGLTALDGYGVLVEGFEHRQLMSMTGYNPASYASMIERAGFRKEVDFVSYELRRDTFSMPESVKRIAARAERRLSIVRYRTRGALVRAARRIRETYNAAFVNNWEYYPLTAREVDFLVEQVRPIADPDLMTFIASRDRIVGFLLAFPDVSAALQRMRGRLTPWGVARVLLERGRTRTVALNGAGIVPEYQGHGGNALLYVQIERAIRESHFDTAELPQVAETATRMRQDLTVLGARPIKTHRVYVRQV